MVRIFKTLQHDSRLCTMCPRADPEIVVGRRKLKILEELCRHLDVVVLTGVHYDFLPPLAQCSRQRRQLDKLGARPNYRDDLH